MITRVGNDFDEYYPDFTETIRNIVPSEERMNSQTEKEKLGVLEKLKEAINKVYKDADGDEYTEHTQ